MCARTSICIGTDPFHTPGWLVQLGTHRFAAAGLSVAVDRPYSLTLLPAEHQGRQPLVHGIMIEVNRRLYMHEGSGARGAAFAEIARIVRAVVLEVLTECRSQVVA